MARVAEPEYKDYVNFLASYKNVKRNKNQTEITTNFENSKTQKLIPAELKLEQKVPSKKTFEEAPPIKSEVLIELQRQKSVSEVSQIFENNNNNNNNKETKKSTLESKISLFEKQNSNVKRVNSFKTVPPVKKIETISTVEESNLLPAFVNDEVDRSKPPMSFTMHVNIQIEGNTNAPPPPSSPTFAKSNRPPQSGIQTKTSVAPPPQSGMQTKISAVPMPQSGMQTKTSVAPPPQSGMQTKISAVPMPQSGMQTKTSVAPPPQSGMQTKISAVPMPQYELQTKTSVAPPPQSGMQTKTSVAPPPQSGMLPKTSAASPPQSGIQTTTSAAPPPPPPPPPMPLSAVKQQPNKIQATLNKGPNTTYSVNTKENLPVEIDRNNPLVRKLVYGTLRGMYGAYHDKANDMVSTMPKSKVVRSNGVQALIEQIAANGGLDKLNGRINPKFVEE